MKLHTLVVVTSSILLCSCGKDVIDDPCPQYLPAIPTTPAFILVDKTTGEDVFGGKINLEGVITASQPCNSNKISVKQLDYPNTDSIPHNFFMLQNPRFDVGYDKNACHTIYMTLSGNDIDTLEFTGVVNLYQDRCNTSYNFDIQKITYNGVEAPVKWTGVNAGQGAKYYILRK